MVLTTSMACPFGMGQEVTFTLSSSVIFKLNTQNYRVFFIVAYTFQHYNTFFEKFCDPMKNDNF